MMKAKNLTFEKLKKFMVNKHSTGEMKFDGCENYESVADIPSVQIFELIQYIKNPPPKKVKEKAVVAEVAPNP